ncbi:hypothetical protein EVAR_31197_1 [Eumeta japonica]|uniref:Uncharacterized protein n=1 Tax=Eumeta variegata TaxID=151549 RepID=A0A4C1VWZ6_EUMVA|nr:hypothetical protein EVAR_31197_1 [Eumeta japonica]
MGTCRVQQTRLFIESASIPAVKRDPELRRRCRSDWRRTALCLPIKAVEHTKISHEAYSNRTLATTLVMMVFSASETMTEFSSRSKVLVTSLLVVDAIDYTETYYIFFAKPTGRAG